MNRYQKLLCDPRWQRKRLEIMQRDGWCCVRCGNGAEELHVDHIKYIAGRMPWEYPGSHLQTLCRSCHEGKHDIRSQPAAVSYPPPSFLYLNNPVIKGVVINWTDERDAGFSMFDYIPWTGEKDRVGDPDRNEIYVCVDREGREFRIDAGCARAFLFPSRLDVDTVTFRQRSIPFSSSELTIWLNMIRDLVRSGERDFD